MCEATGYQTLSLNIMSLYFANDMFDTIKRQKYSLYLAIFEITDLDSRLASDFTAPCIHRDFVILRGILNSNN